MRPENITSILGDLRRLGIPVTEDLLHRIDYDQQTVTIRKPISDFGIASCSMAGRLTLVFEQHAGIFYLDRFQLTIFDKRWLSAPPCGIIALTVQRNHPGCPQFSQALASVLQTAKTLQHQATTLAKMLHPDVFPWTVPPAGS